AVWRATLDLGPAVPAVLFQVARAHHRLGRLGDATDPYLGGATLGKTPQKALAALAVLASPLPEYPLPPPEVHQGRSRAIARGLASVVDDSSSAGALVRAIAKCISRDAGALVFESPDAALVEFELALTLAPNLPEALRGAATCLERLGEFERAMATL